MNQSETIGKLALALSKAQSEIKNASKDSANPFFKSNYADLASVWNAIREPLSKNELCVIQTTRESTDPNTVVLETILAHSSGEFVRSVTSSQMPQGTKGPQVMGSAITYCRRYALAAIVGVAQADDDGNSAQEAIKSSAPDPKRVAVPVEPQKELKSNTAVKAQGQATSPDLEYIIPFGRFAGKRLKEIHPKDARAAVEQTELKMKGLPIPKEWAEPMAKLLAYANSQ